MAPNLLFITLHDTGRYFGCYGVPTADSPNVDALAADGVRMDRCFAAATCCSPSRGAMLTGRYPQANGLAHLTNATEAWRLHGDERLLGQYLREADYHCVLHGHQHEVGHDEVPARQGHHEAWNHGLIPGVWTHPPADIVGRDAEQWLRVHAPEDRPFFMQLGFFETHQPFLFGGAEADDPDEVTVPPWVADTPAIRLELAELQGALRKVDAAIGRVLDTLDELGKRDDTLVLFTVDHGLPEEGAKHTLYDPGMEVACILRYPAGGVAGGRSSDRLVSNVDFLPTILELADVPLPANLHGRSFADTLRGEEAAAPRDHVFASHVVGERRCVRSRTHKLIRNVTAQRIGVRPPVLERTAMKPHNAAGEVPAPLVELYDLRTDPLEHHNLADDPDAAAVRAELDAELWAWLQRIDDPILHGLTPPPRWHEHMTARPG